MLFSLKLPKSEYVFRHVGTFGKARPMHVPIGNLPGQVQHRAPGPHQMQDLLRMFDGFAKPGKLRAGASATR